MHFSPKTEKEIAEMGLWPIGTYSFEIIERVSFGDREVATSDTTSKKGNDMIQLVVNCYNETGETKILIDYILETTASKLRNVCVACELIKAYEAGQLFASDFIGKKGELRLGIEKDKNGQYPDKNKIVNYITEKGEVKKDLHPFDPANEDMPF